LALTLRAATDGCSGGLLEDAGVLLLLLLPSFGVQLKLDDEVV
jgi:hypothetical protein